MTVNLAATMPNHETFVGTVQSGAFTNTTYTIALGPGIWRVALFINGNGIATGTIVAAATLPDGTAGELDSPEALSWTNGTTTSMSASLALTDFIGVTMLNISGNPGTNIPVGGASLAVPVYSSIVLTLASITGASSTNRIDYVASRVW